MRRAAATIAAGGDEIAQVDVQLQPKTSLSACFFAEQLLHEATLSSLLLKVAHSWPSPHALSVHVTPSCRC